MEHHPRLEPKCPTRSRTFPAFSPPQTRPLSSSPEMNRITGPKGIVGCYDISDISDQMRYFETKRNLIRRETQVRPSTSRWDAIVTSKPRDAIYTKKRPQVMSGENTSQWPLKRLGTRSCYVDFTGSFNDKVEAQSLPLAVKHSAPVVRQHSQKDETRRMRKRSPAKTKNPKRSNALEIKDGLLVIANGKIVDLKPDKKRSDELHEDERKRLREEMRQHFDVVRSFDELFETLDTTKLQIEELKAS